MCVYILCVITKQCTETHTGIFYSNCQSRTIFIMEFKALLWTPLHSSTPHYLINTDLTLTINKGKIRHREREEGGYDTFATISAPLCSCRSSIEFYVAPPPGTVPSSMAANVAFLHLQF